MNLLSKEFLMVALGGAIGSVTRFGFSRWIQQISHHRDFPWGIFLVNTSGCLLMGILYGLLIHKFNVGPVWRAGILIGFLGGYTTFSSFSIDTIVLIHAGDILSAFLNVFLTLLICFTMTTFGIWLVRFFS